MKTCTFKKSKKLCILFFCFLPLVLFAQKKPLVKLEIPFAVNIDNDIDAGGQLRPTLILPTIYVPIGQHVDLGLSYNTIKTYYQGTIENSTPTTTTYTPFDGAVKHNFPSFYFRVNISKYRRTINPFLGYILSVTKGEYTPGAGEENRGFYFFGSKMTTAEETILSKAVAKTEVAHGAQAGVDIHVSKTIAIFTKGVVYSITDGKAFPYQYYTASSQYNIAGFRYRNPVFGMVGLVIKFSGGKKTDIK